MGVDEYVMSMEVSASGNILLLSEQGAGLTRS